VRRILARAERPDVVGVRSIQLTPSYDGGAEQPVDIRVIMLGTSYVRHAKMLDVPTSV